MKIITCFKLVPEEQDIVVTPEYTLNFDNADAKISQFDLNAIEAASQLATDDDEIAALTVGGSLLQNSKVRKDVLSRGPHSLYLVQDAQLEHALPLDTAKALAAAIEKIGFDLLIFGEGSGDLYAQQVGLLVGEILQLPVINAVSAIQRQGNTLVIERTLEDDVEVIELSVPADAMAKSMPRTVKPKFRQKPAASPTIITPSLTICGTIARPPSGTICPEYSSSLPPLISGRMAGCCLKSSSICGTLFCAWAISPNPQTSPKDMESLLV